MIFFFFEYEFENSPGSLSPSCSLMQESVYAFHSLPKNEHSRVKEFMIFISLKITALAVVSLHFSILNRLSLRLKRLFLWQHNSGMIRNWAFLILPSCS